MPSPTDVSGLWTWLRASVIGIGDGDTITTWEDSSSNNKDGTANGNPTYQTNELNGKAIVRFDGSGDFFALPDMSALTAGTGFLVVKLDADPPGAEAQTGVWKIGSASGGGTANHFPYIDGTIYDSFGSTARKSTANPTPSLASWRVYEAVSQASEWTSYLDGTQLFTTGTNTAGFNASPNLGHSHDDGGGNHYYLDGDVAEFIMYDSALSQGNRQIVEQYIFDEYAVGVDHGLTDSTPIYVVRSSTRFA